MSSYWSKFTLVLCCALISAVAAFAQPKSNSPYSRLGFGDPFNQNFTLLNGMGDISSAFQDYYTLNLVNPASLGSLQFTSFEVGVNARLSSLEGDAGTEKIWSGNLSHLALGFPIINPLNKLLDREKSPFSWGMSFALLPYTTVGYNVENSGPINGVDTVSFSYQGSGGSSRFVWGNGFKFDNFSAGINIGYLFGKTVNERFVTFDNLEASYQDILNDDISVSGFIWNLGLQYKYQFMEKNKEGEMVPSGKYITVGLNGNSTNSFNTTSTSLYQRLNVSYSDIDTIQSVEGLSGKGKLPSEIAIGVMAGNLNKWRAGVNFTTTAWSKYENDAKPDALQDAFRFSIGGEFTPDFISYNNYFERVRYRLGVFYANDPRVDAFNEQLTNYGITIGFGLPIILPRQEQSFLNIAFELGQFGSKNSLRETYGRVSVGFTLNDNKWFLKRKFN